jgi:hypothetical protein
MAKDEGYEGQHREQDPTKVVGAAIRLLLAETLKTRGTAVFEDIERLDPEARAIIYRAIEDE